MQANGVYLLNPLLCMNKKYFENVLKKPYNKAKIFITKQYGIPTKILFIFSSPSDASSLKNTTLNISNLISTSKFILLIV